MDLRKYRKRSQSHCPHQRLMSKAHAKRLLILYSVLDVGGLQNLANLSWVIVDIFNSRGHTFLLRQHETKGLRNFT